MPAGGEAFPYSGNADGHVRVPFKSAAWCRRRTRSEEGRAKRLFLVFVGLILITIGGVSAVRQLELQRTWISTTGTVIGTEQCDSNSGGESSQSKQAVIEYHVDEATYTVTSDVCQSPHPQVGSNIAVLYHPDDPANGVDASFWSSWLIPIILLPMGLLLSCVALFGKLHGSDRAVRNDFDQSVQDA